MSLFVTNAITLNKSMLSIGLMASSGHDGDDLTKAGSGGMGSSIDRLQVQVTELRKLEAEQRQQALKLVGQMGLSDVENETLGIFHTRIRACARLRPTRTLSVL